MEESEIEEMIRKIHEHQQHTSSVVSTEIPTTKINRDGMKKLGYDYIGEV